MPTYLPATGPVTSGYGRRTAPTAGASSNHRGVDFGGNSGDPIFAPVDLRVQTLPNSSGGFGNLAIGTDAAGNQHYFGHLSGFAVSGGQVAAGQQIGFMGSTGRSTGNHLHYEIRTPGGGRINPSEYLKGALKTTKDKGKEVVGAAIEAIPVIGKPIKGLTDAFGMTGDCSLICQLQNWSKSTEIIQRTAYIMIALIFIGGALYVFGTGQTRRTLSQAIK